MAEGREYYDTWHGMKLIECVWCGYFFDPEYYKETCPECGARRADIVEWNT